MGEWMYRSLRKIGFDDELDRTDSESCPLVGFSMSDVEPSGPAARELWVPRGLRHSGLTRWPPSTRIYVYWIIRLGQPTRGVALQVRDGSRSNSPSL
jgi:hypothetical protein